ncbi:LysM peptidoglycan-binding domain-containing protein [Panacibacter sp. DH6]|uniref:LysM peptidoglycan-binding domain-containing protein n=1 Tax=Panacibacter microcysteis TaxID=2793269 RepID=A0A931EA84_9BACT|nr:LysM peptidoglycan-binding domain-containing protein [Panacibacter microcysteis]MBG9376576.1 LysM peptidoglycan-binding domain-containing protein [Panacibacter microcysteis]
MKKMFLLLFSCTVLMMNVFAQKYTEHTLAQGETLSMLAEKYKTTVGDIMRLNGMHADTKLVIGQKIKIPGSGQPITRPGETKTSTPAAKPVTTTPPKGSSKAITHVVGPKETMYSISKKYGVTIDQLQQWNYKKDNSLEIGEILAVSVNGIPEAVKQRQALQSQAISSPPQQSPPLIVNEPVIDNATQQKKAQEPAKEVIVKEEVKPVAPVVTETKKERPAGNAAPDGSDNFFAKDFATLSGNASGANGIAMIFKTASGWNDKKYYVLMNEAPSGSIVKISASNGNVVYAKVLWRLDDMKENKGLQFRISEAAAAALNVQGDKFPLSVQYYQ